MAGGSLIAAAACALLLGNGDILGASGILSSVFATPQQTAKDPKQFWKLVLTSSFLFTSTYLLGSDYIYDHRTVNDSSVPRPSTIGYILSGLLVGFGTRLGNGCTSGHGVCGLGRRSQRSLAGVLAFMASAVATVTLTSPESSLSDYTAVLRSETSTGDVDSALGARFTTAIMFLTLFHYRLNHKKFSPEDRSKFFVGGIAGALFSAGLAISQMVLGSKLYGFLNVGSMSTGGWDPTLATVLGAAVPISMLSYEVVHGFSMFNKSKTLTKPIAASKFSVPVSTTIDYKLIVGTAIFGIGWGMGLLCPGPALYHAAVGNKDVLFRWLPSFVVGSYTALKFKEWHATPAPSK